jgi:hypothetical protein
MIYDSSMHYALCTTIGAYTGFLVVTTTTTTTTTTIIMHYAAILTILLLLLLDYLDIYYRCVLLLNIIGVRILIVIDNSSSIVE